MVEARADQPLGDRGTLSCRRRGLPAGALAQQRGKRVRFDLVATNIPEGLLLVSPDDFRASPFVKTGQIGLGLPTKIRFTWKNPLGRDSCGREAVSKIPVLLKEPAGGQAAGGDPG
jgi:hypothetical protein